MGRPPALDRKEIEALFRAYGPLVRRRARSILGNDEEADDATQEVFVRVLANLKAFRGESRPSTWLYRITTNLCLNRIRDQRRHKERLDRAAADGTAEPDPPRTPGVEARATLRTVLAQVPPDLAEVAVHYHVDEMDQEEIAGLMGVSRRTVGYRLERFRDEAQRILSDRPAATEPVAADGVPRVLKARGDEP